MDTNNLFQNWTNQNPGGSFGNGTPNYYQYGGNMNMNPAQSQSYGGFINRTSSPSPSNIPVRVVFSPEQIAPQEIPTNGTPALFPLNDGSCIIAKALGPNGTFDERRYVLEEKNEISKELSQFDQVMNRLGKIEESLGSILNDLYGSKTESLVKKEEE